MRAGDLKEVQKYVSGNLDISNKKLTSLEGCPEKIDKSVSICKNIEKVSLGFFICSDNELKSFEHFPKYIRMLCLISNNKFTSFKDIDQHIEYIGKSLHATGMNITSGFSDLFGIDGLKEIEIDNSKIETIVNRYLRKKDLIEFQDEMIKTGYESYL